MGTNTYANSNEICSKSSSGKTMGAMPDPCFTPPPTPAGVEVVVPYPNTAMASDLDKGSAKVLICNKMAALEKDSYMKTSMGDEAAKPSTMQGGVVTKTTKGKAVFTNWSPDVKFEGKGVCRHIDPTTHNHDGTPGHCVPMSFVSSVNPGGKCDDEIKKVEEKCHTPPATKEINDKQEETTSFIIDGGVCDDLKDLPTAEGSKKIQITTTDGHYVYIAKKFKKNGARMSRAAASMAAIVEEVYCLRAMRCVLHKFKDTENSKPNNGTLTCCPGQSGHHVVPSAMGYIKCLGTRANAPVICVEGVGNCHGTHGMIHRNLSRKLKKKPELSCNEILGVAASSVQSTFSDCKTGCVLAQMKSGKQKCKCEDVQNFKTKSGLTCVALGKIEKAY